MINDLDTIPVPAIPSTQGCQCKHPCQFSWFPFILTWLVIMLYIMIITTILIYKLLI